MVADTTLPANVYNTDKNTRREQCKGEWRALQWQGGSFHDELMIDDVHVSC